LQDCDQGVGYPRFKPRAELAMRPQGVTTVDATRVLATLRRAAQQPEVALDAIKLTGAEPILCSSFAVGTAVRTTIAAAALAAGELWRLRRGQRQHISVDMRDAAVEFRSEHHLRVNGVADGCEPTGRRRSGRARRSCPPRRERGHHRNRLLALLGCDDDREAVQRALCGWNAEGLEAAAAEAGLVVTACSSFSEWDEHPRGGAIAKLPLFAIDKIGDAPAEPLTTGDRPLAGIRVLDLARITGPVCGRTLAAHGADVLRVKAPHLPDVEPLVIDTGRGKLFTVLDLREKRERDMLAALLQKADIFFQGYRPDAIAGFGFCPQDAARIRPGIVYVSLCAYGDQGSWAARRGFASAVQAASGRNADEAKAAGIDKPKPLPAQALDHGTGYLMALAAMTALAHRAEQGGSWYVRTSLAQTGDWIRQLGRIDGMACPNADDVNDRLETQVSGFGDLTAIRHAAIMTDTPPHLARPSIPPGTHAPGWRRASQLHRSSKLSVRVQGVTTLGGDP